MCVAGARLDQDCFIIGTDPKGRKYKDIWSIVNIDYKQKLINKEEITRLYQVMDLDRDGIVNDLEVSAWFKRNENVLCRPRRKVVIRYLKIKEKRIFKDIFRFLDGNNNGKIHAFEAPAVFKRIDDDHDGTISFDEFNVIEKSLEKLCKELITFDKEAWLEKSRPGRDNKNNLFEVVDRDGDGFVSEAEFKELYSQIDKNQDFKVHSDEVQTWIWDHLGSICAKKRAEIVKAVEVREFVDSVL